MSTVLRLIEHNIKYWPENLPVDMCFEFDERVFEFGEFFKQKMLVKHTYRVDVFHDKG